VPPLPSSIVSNPPSPDSSPTHSPRSSCADLGLHGGERQDDALLKTLLDEVRGTKQELKSEISVFYQTVERRLAQTEEKMNSILALLPFRTAGAGSSALPAACTTTSPSSQALSASMRAELTRQLPFLSDFNVESLSVPFVVDDLAKPILAQRFPEATRVEDMLPPTIVWANDSFCSLVNVPLVRARVLRLPPSVRHGTSSSIATLTRCMHGPCSTSCSAGEDKATRGRRR
jgi:hypothetical protein